MGVNERKQREKEHLRQAILDAAGEMFLNEGYENVSIRKIARKIEYAPTTIYLYFKDKADLFQCLMNATYSKFIETQKEVMGVDPFSDLIESMRKGMRAYIEFGLNYPNYYRLIFMTDMTALGKNINIINDKLGNDSYNILRTLVAACIEQKLFKAVDLNLATQLIWSLNHGVTSLLINSPGFSWVDRETLINQSIEMAINAFKV
jgi:AcrR family transcriptional regulator